ncbi:MAG TPA: ATP-binding cassette domain-containing protein [Fervidobacterium sp.]|nr:ATP-binding cassette domain-containing protein [Fervidobacterium sp.]NLH37511.1 ATP-binding cassette domain-containing protein [Thermotogaceae bacterium]MBP9518696.1 ATP-binding cassette domain-containing protein [Fervidobacterium sp.]HCI29437.1 multidrug ABC transporter ATP-binding protein [Fervidobacterium sp.]HOH52845.1 ATP-binding cassette domain-containing protein [Fervidobacterium sp.]
MIKVEQLYKYFKQVKALDGISFEVKKGELFGLLGPNGAGKTTTVRIISTLIPPTKGQVEINGYFLPKDAAIIRNFIGYVPQALSSDGTLTGYENLLIFAKLVGLNRSEREKQINELVELMGIGDFVDRLVREYSGGMVRKLEIAQALLHNPKVLLLDEPTVGLDPASRRSVWDVLKTLQEKYDSTILLTTHYMEEAEALCDRIAIMDHGKIVIIGTPKEIMEQAGVETLEDAFIVLTGHEAEEGGNFNELKRVRKTARRLQ